MSLPAFITVRSQSTRLPNKCLLEFGDGNVLQHIIRRARFFNFMPIVCTTQEKSDDIIVDICSAEEIEVFRGSTINKLRRWLDCCIYFGVEKFHTIDADDPFFDPVQVIDSYALLNHGYDIVYPTISSSMGGASVGFSIKCDALLQVCETLNNNQDTEMAWYYFDALGGINKTRLDDSYNDPKNIRLTLDYKEDYWLLETVRRILGNNASRQEVNKLFKDNPDFRLINWFRNTEWEKNQKSKSTYPAK